MNDFMLQYLTYNQMLVVYVLAIIIALTLVMAFKASYKDYQTKRALTQRIRQNRQLTIYLK
jgi:hypothetical protein